MNFRRIREGENIFSYKKKASTAFAKGDLVGIEEASGFLIPVVTGDTGDTIIGVIGQDILSTDADYAETSEVSIDRPSEICEFRAVVGTGTATQAMVGSKFGIDGDGQVDVTDTTNLVVEITRFISGTEVEVKFVI